MKMALGKKQVQIAVSFLPSLMGFGAAGGLALLYYTDWKAVLQYVPIYGSKFPKDKEEE